MSLVQHEAVVVEARFELQDAFDGGVDAGGQGAPRRVRRVRSEPGANAVKDGGELVGATEAEVTIAADAGVIAIPYADIRKSNLVEEQ